MHHVFSYHRPQSADDALHRLAEPGAVPLGGGTDLLVAVEEELIHPSTLVDLRRVPGWRGIEHRADGSVRIGAATRIHDLAFDETISSRWPALALACRVVGTPALRRMGTIGGNLCQRPRCWYYRRKIPCLKNGGHDCPASRESAENQYLAILEGGPCHIVHPSDPAVALMALGAQLELERADGSRVVPIEEFYVLPSERLDHETVLTEGEVVRAVILTADTSGGVQQYHKLMQREAWDFALVSIAAVRREDGDVRMAMGGVAPRPWRIPSSVEEDIASGGLDDDAIDALAERALYDVQPLSKNGYKVELATTLLRRAARELTEA